MQGGFGAASVYTSQSWVGGSENESRSENEYYITHHRGLKMPREGFEPCDPVKPSYTCGRQDHSRSGHRSS